MCICTNNLVSMVSFACLRLVWHAGPEAVPYCIGGFELWFRPLIAAQQKGSADLFTFTMDCVCMHDTRIIK